MKVTMKIFKEVYRKLQVIKLENECRSLSDAIALLIERYNEKI